MKLFNAPELEILKFNVEDVIATSNGGTETEEDEF